MWVGLWTGSDSVNADGTPSEWTGSFPGLCMHRHAWPIFALRELAGVRYSAEGVRVRPGLPVALGPFSWHTARASISWDGNGTWWGHYFPAGATGAWGIHFDASLVLPPQSRFRIRAWAVEGADAAADATSHSPPPAAASARAFERIAVGAGAVQLKVASSGLRYEVVAV